MPRPKGWNTKAVKREYYRFGDIYDRIAVACGLPKRVGKEKTFDHIGRFYDVVVEMTERPWDTPDGFTVEGMPWLDEEAFRAAIDKEHSWADGHINFSWLLSMEQKDKGGMPKIRGLMQRNQKKTEKSPWQNLPT